MGRQENHSSSGQLYPTVKLEFEWNKPNIFPMALT